MLKPRSAIVAAGSKSCGQGMRPWAAVRTFKHRDDAWHSDRKAADSDRLPRARCAVRIQKKLFTGGGRCSLAPVIGLYDPSRRIVVEQKAAAADAGGLRFDEAQHHLRRDRRIDSVAACFEDVGARLCGSRVSRRDHRVLRADRGVVRAGTDGHQ